jgi:recombination protein RecA
MGMTLAEKKKKLDKLAEQFNKQKGKTLIGRLSECEDLQNQLKMQFVETPSLKVNAALGGGWPKGRITIVAGNPDSGKTFMLLETIAINMKKNPDFIAAWLESEQSVSEKDFEMFGIDTSRLFFLNPDTLGGAEEAIDAVQSALLTCEIDMFVINSLKCLVPKEELDSSMTKLQVGLQARMNAKMIRKLTSIISEQNCAFIMVQHLTTQIGGMIFGDPLIIGGGKAIMYGASIICDMRKLSIQQTDPISKEEGVKISFTVKKNHVVTDKYPYVKTEYYGIFGQGTERYLEIIDLAINEGILVKSGAFIKMPDENGDPQVINGEKMQWQGNSKFRQYCIEHEDFFNQLKDMVTNGNVNDSLETLSDEEVEEIKEAEKNLELAVKEEHLDEDIIEKSKSKKKDKQEG